MLTQTSFSRPPVKVRLWLLAAMCFGCGVTCRIVFGVAARPNDSADAMGQWSLQTLWYTAALLLVYIHLWRMGTSGRPPAELPGCVTVFLACAGLFLVYLFSVWSALPDK